MREAGAICTHAMNRGIEKMRPGVPQNHVIAEIYHAQIMGVPGAGGDYAAICPLMPVGEGTSTPHLTWSDAPLPDNGLAMLEIAGVRRRYHAALTRTMHFGKPPAAYRDHAKAIVEGVDAGLELARPGNTCEQVEAAWQAVLRQEWAQEGEPRRLSGRLAYPPDWGERTVSLRPGDKTELAARHVLPLHGRRLARRFRHRHLGILRRHGSRRRTSLRCRARTHRHRLNASKNRKDPMDRNPFSEAEIAGRLAKVRTELGRARTRCGDLRLAGECLLSHRPRSLGLFRAASADRSARRQADPRHALDGEGDDREPGEGREFRGHSDSETAADLAARVLSELGLTGKRIGLECWTSGLSHGLASKLEAQADARWSDVSGLVDTMRRVKSAEEQALMRRAAKVTDAAAGAAIAAISDGAAEQEVAAECVAAMIRAGGHAPGFGPFIRPARAAWRRAHDLGRRRLPQAASRSSSSSPAASRAITRRLAGSSASAASATPMRRWPRSPRRLSMPSSRR